MADEKQFDPRYDPAYQRGFEGRPSRTTGATAPVSSGGSQLASRPPTSQRIVRPATPQRDLPAQLGFDAVPSAEISKVVGTAEASPLAAMPAAPVTRNPFLYALIGLSVVLIVLGVWARYNSIVTFSGSFQGSREQDIVVAQMYDAFSPWLVVTGLLTGVGVLFVYALKWRASPR